MQTYPTDAPDDLRQLAVTRLRKKRELQAHVLAYVMVNLFLNAIWLLTMPGGFYWPVFPLLGWGIGLAFHIWDVYGPAQPTEEQIEREMHRLSPR
jgi:2TM domain